MQGTSTGATTPETPETSPDAWARRTAAAALFQSQGPRTPQDLARLELLRKNLLQRRSSARREKKWRLFLAHAADPPEANF